VELDVLEKEPVLDKLCEPVRELIWDGVCEREFVKELQGESESF